MAVQRKFDTITVVCSAADLSAHQFMPVQLDGLIAETTLPAIGLLQNKPLNGDHMTVGYKGQMKAFAGAAINSDAQLGVTTSGFIIAVTTSAYIGKTLVQVASGDLFTGIFDFNMGQIA